MDERADLVDSALEMFPLTLSQALFQGLTMDLDSFATKQRSVVPYDLTIAEAVDRKAAVHKCEQALEDILSLYPDREPDEDEETGES